MIVGPDIVDGRHQIAPMISCRNCNAKVWIQERVGKATNDPDFSICCSKGQVILDPLFPPEPALVNFIGGNNDQSRSFRLNVRLYNSALSFTSLGAKIDEQYANARGGNYTFRLHGTAVHLLGSMLPPRLENGPERAPSFAQIYFYDPEIQTAHRNAIFGNKLNPYVLDTLTTLFERTNELCHQFKSIWE